MTSRTVSVCKFVGTVSLGLLTGLSYSLSTVTVPTLFSLPSASAASRALASVTSTARTHLRLLAGLSGTAFFLAYLLSPRPLRHPYLLYTSALVLTSRLATSGPLAPYLFAAPRRSGPGADERRQRAQARQDQRAAAAGMEASYEVLGSGGSSSDAHSEEGSEGGAEDERHTNGEEVRGEVESFLQRQVAQTVVAGLSFLVAIVGIWGDGAVQVFSRETLVIGV